MLYKRVSIPNFNKNELRVLEKNFIDSPLVTFYDPDIKRFPQLYFWLLEHSRYLIDSCRVYRTPPHAKFGMHIDGGAFNRSFAALNIPVSGCQNTSTCWWDESNAKMEHGYFGLGRTFATKILNPNEVKCLERIEIDQPTLIRTDIIHSVENPNDTPRFCMAIRWKLENVKSLEDIL